MLARRSCHGRRGRANGNTEMAILEAVRLTKHFQARRGIFGGSSGTVRAVDDISFSVESGQTLGVVGESGCGKTTTGKLVLGLETPTGGSIRFDGQDLQDLDKAGRRHYRKSVQAVFQDPYASLNPRMRIADIIAEPLVTNETLSASEVRKRVHDLLDLVGLPEHAADLFPHEFYCRRAWWCWMNRCLRSTYRSARRSLTCCATCRRSWGCPICSSPTTSRRSRI